MIPSVEKRRSFLKSMFWLFMYANGSLITFKMGQYFYENGINWETVTSRHGMLIIFTTLFMLVYFIVDDNVRYESQGGFSRRELRKIFKDRNEQLRKKHLANKRDPRW